MLTKLNIYNFRGLTDFELALEPGINLITGENGSGKSSILEAIFYLARGRSFRTSNPEVMIASSEQNFTLRLNLKDGLVIATERYKGGKVRHKIDGENCNTIIELSEHLPVLFLDTDSQRWLAAGPKNRRQTVDWGLFYGIRKDFYQVWREFRRCLLQRNAAIKSGSDFSIWDDLFLEKSLLLDALRKEYVLDLNTALDGIWDICGSAIGAINLKYHSGWSKELGPALQNSHERDKVLGHTSIGPHRADLSIMIDDKPASQYLSQGQQKLLTFAIMLAQAQLFNSDTGMNCLLLLDDICAELDLNRRESILNYLISSQHQVIVTGIVDREIIQVLPDSGWHHVKLNQASSGL